MSPSPPMAPPSLLAQPRRLRTSPRMRRLVAEVDLLPRHLMMPHFVVPGTAHSQPIAALPGIGRQSVDCLLEQVSADLALGIDQVMLFGVLPAEGKDASGSAAKDAQGPVPSAVRALRARFGERLFIATDVCLCPYTDHGHCGVWADGHISSAATLPHLSAMAVVHAAAGADLVVPSDMMDGRVMAIRQALDQAGLGRCALMAYAAKYASAYYGPFRQAANSAPPPGQDRGSYQMDPRCSRQARRQVALDIAAGADMLLVKPALAYLDVLAQARRDSHLPLACYNVSGEYAMVKAAAAAGAIDEARLVRENLWAMRRAGADLILTYHARQVLRDGWLGS